MARVSNSSKAFKGQRHGKSTNASGYAKRKSSKHKTASSSDVYDYEPEKTRRAKIKLQYEKDELLGARGNESGSDSGGEEWDPRKQIRPRLVGEKDDDEGIAEDEDEEIDSDAAFDESDEERFAGFNFSHKPKSKTASKSTANPRRAAKAVRFAEVDLNEDSDAGTPELEEGSRSEEEEEEQEEEGAPDEFIDVLDILDGRGEPDSGNDIGEIERELKGSKEKVFFTTFTARSDGGDAEEPMDEDELSESDDAAQDERESEQEIEADEDAEVDDSALQNLGNFISGLETGTKRKALDDNRRLDAQTEEPRKRKKRILAEQTLGGTENEFSTQTGATKLNLDDLLAPLASSSATLQSLKKSAKALTSTSSKIRTLAAPLPQRTQERLDRAAAYEQTKEEIDGWSNTMKRIKEAEHLSFPLQAEPVGKTSNLELMAKFKPTTVMESAVDRLLKTAKMREQDIAQTESLKMNHLSVEEVAARRAELSKMRELIFRNEAKAKRIAKIKSKTYRRIKKKQKEKLAVKLGELEGSDEEDEEKRMDMEIGRARERATLRHKNNGKWAKAMKHRNELDEDERQAINAMLDRGERLKRRIQGQDSDDESAGSDDDESVGDGEDAIERIKVSAFDELAELREEGDIAEPQGKKAKGVFEMKFMQDAMLRDKQRADKMADDFIKEMGGTLSGIGSDAEEHGVGEQQNPDTAIQRVGGRVSYRPGAMPTLNVAPSLASDTSSATLKSTDMLNDSPQSPAVTPQVEGPAAGPSTSGPSNPWLVIRDDVQVAQKKHEVVVGKDSGSAERSKNKLRKRVKKREEERERAKEDAMVDVSMTNVMTLASGSPAALATKSDTKGKQRQADPVVEDGEASDVNSEIDEQEKVMESKAKGKKTKGVTAFVQRDLVALAFAGDNVVRDFEETKRREIREDAPKEVDTTLPGWGSWGGLGTKRAPPKPYLIKKIAGVDPKSRADYSKAHVIISEKRDKKAAKYLVKDLPYPYTSKAQFERNMDTPIGAEWNTRVGFQRGTLPKVIKKMGAVITPLEKLQ